MTAETTAPADLVHTEPPAPVVALESDHGEALIEINKNTQPGSVVFCGGSREMLRLEPNGGFYVNGERAPSSTGEDAEGIYQAFIHWMRTSNILR